MADIRFGTDIFQQDALVNLVLHCHFTLLLLYHRDGV
jgi:hypothetical protein